MSEFAFLRRGWSKDYCSALLIGSNVEDKRWIRQLRSSKQRVQSPACAAACLSAGLTSSPQACCQLNGVLRAGLLCCWWTCRRLSVRPCVFSFGSEGLSSGGGFSAGDRISSMLRTQLTQVEPAHVLRNPGMRTMHLVGPVSMPASNSSASLTLLLLPCPRHVITGLHGGAGHGVPAARL